MPVYNGEEFVEHALESIPKRDDIEVIIINDGSTDNTYDIVYKFGEESMKEFPDMCFISVDRDENKGIGYSRREALKYAKGEYIMFFDVDDEIIGENFNKALEMLDGSDIVYYDLMQNDGVRLHLSPATKGIYPGAVKFIKKLYINRFEYPVVRKFEDVKFNGMLNSVEHSERYTDLVVVNYNFPRYDSTSAKWLRGEL